MALRDDKDLAWETILDADHVRLQEILRVDPEYVDRLDQHGNTVLLRACAAGDVGLVRLLLENGARPEHANDGGHRAIHFATYRGHAEVVRLLLDAPYRVDAACGGIDKRTPLMLAAACGHTDVLQVLLEKRRAFASLNMRDKEGCTAVWHACRNGRLAAVELLKSVGADLDITDKEGRTPSEAAREWDNFECANIAQPSLRGRMDARRSSAGTDGTTTATSGRRPSTASRRLRGSLQGTGGGGGGGAGVTSVLSRLTAESSAEDERHAEARLRRVSLQEKSKVHKDGMWKA